MHDTTATPATTPACRYCFAPVDYPGELCEPCDDRNADRMFAPCFDATEEE